MFWVLVMSVCLSGSHEMCDISTKTFATEKQCQSFSEKEVQSWQKLENIQWLKIQSRYVTCVKMLR